MRKGQFNPFVSSAAIACALLYPSLALANDAEVAEASVDAEIVVAGSISESQAASVEEKRKALNLVDVAAADAVGRFPDQNSAAALSRLPAVAVQRDQGQERYIQVRGAPNRWTSVMIDGVPMIGVDEGGDSRAFRFDAVPAVLLSSMVINKSLTPALQADAIVATIDLQTYSPLARKGLHIDGDIGYGFMDHGNGEQRQGSLRLSWANDVVGIVLGGSHYRRKQLTDNREVGLYDEPTSPSDTTFGPTEIDIRQYQIERWNNGLFAGIEYEPAAGQRIYAKAIFTEFSDDEQRNQYELRLDRAASGFRNLSAGDLVSVPVRGSFNYGEYRNRNYIGTIGGDLETDSGLKVSAKLNYARTDNQTYLPLVQASTGSGLGSPSLTYDRSDPRFPVVTLYNTIAGPTAGTFARGTAATGFNQRSLSAAGAIMIAAQQQTVSDSYTVKLDIEKQLGNLTLSAGGLFADRTIAGNNFSFSNVAALGALGSVVNQPFDVNAYVTDKPWNTQFPLGFALNYIDNRGMRRDIDSLVAKLVAAGRFDPEGNIPLTDRYSQTEKTYAGYVMASADLGKASITGGVRVEHYVLGNRGTARIGAVNTPLADQRSYTDLFPSLNARIELADDLVFRIGGQRGVSRPAYGAIRIGSSINDTASPGTVGGGNPALAPEYTWGLDSSLEWYLPGNGILAVSGFHRWVNNVFYQNTQAVGSNVFNSGGVDRSSYLLTSTFNGTNGRLYGVEMNFQQRFTFLPSPLDGFGFQGNLTLLGGKFDTQLVNGSQRKGIPFPGLSDTIANASLYFEKYGLSARVSYQWRGDWFDSLGGFGSGESRRGYDNLDVSLRYKVTDNFTVFADASNLTNAMYVAYEDSMDKPTEVEQIGARYMFGVRFNF
ncbi:TonB-dependent receptor [Novosphingobium sp. TH158]|uniref:TonB-dependent receptor n=1 Tax=Novosphingobium sp. TH158 TaxID=2067455 RepID=UPI000C7B1E93|nr:TonB-dependent receptor [Novosphingobium sp. TH158]PLK26708.1 TonB-dependent receptor [Novosphingobium sp. TH158]